MSLLLGCFDALRELVSLSCATDRYVTTHIHLGLKELYESATTHDAGSAEGEHVLCWSVIPSRVL